MLDSVLGDSPNPPVGRNEAEACACGHAETMHAGGYVCRGQVPEGLNGVRGCGCVVFRRWSPSTPSEAELREVVRGAAETFGRWPDVESPNPGDFSPEFCDHIVNTLAAALASRVETPRVEVSGAVEALRAASDNVRSNLAKRRARGYDDGFTHQLQHDVNIWDEAVRIVSTARGERTEAPTYRDIRAAALTVKEPICSGSAACHDGYCERYEQRHTHCACRGIAAALAATRQGEKQGVDFDTALAAANTVARHPHDIIHDTTLGAIVDAVLKVAASTDDAEALLALDDEIRQAKQDRRSPADVRVLEEERERAASGGEADADLAYRLECAERRAADAEARASRVWQSMIRAQMLEASTDLKPNELLPELIRQHVEKTVREYVASSDTGGVSLHERIRQLADNYAKWSQDAGRDPQAAETLNRCAVELRTALAGAAPARGKAAIDTEAARFQAAAMRGMTMLETLGMDPQRAYDIVFQPAGSARPTTSESNASEGHRD